MCLCPRHNLHSYIQTFFLFLERLPPVPSILPPVWPFSTLMPHTVSRWGSCGHPSDVLWSQRESTEPCSIISPKILFWKTLRPRDAEISSVTQKEMVGVHPMFLLQSCFCRHSIIISCLQPLSMNIQLYFFSTVQPSEPGAGDTAYQQSSALQLSPNIRCFVFPRGDISRFKPAR